ncbi:MAG: chemotaxis protein CheA [Chloroflexota bacterium]|nr:chemotaxis protein CheA [Chloroflexota bacterium]
MTENMPDIDLSQFLDLFIDEGQEHLRTLNQCMLTLESDPQNAETLNNMFRAAHSLKGGSATMGYETLSITAHAAEDILHKLRDGDWELNPSLVELLFKAIDALQTLLSKAATGDTSQEDNSITTIIKALRSYEYKPRKADSPPQKPIAEPQPPATPQQPSLPLTKIIRVDVRHLDSLLNVVTEMVIHRSLLSRIGQRYNLKNLKEALEVHSRLLTQLQNEVLKMRMVPIEQIFGRFPRMVRDLLKKEGKEAQLVIEGQDVELDRTALEELNDPLVHALRNAIDHGLETPSERVKNGKPSSGTLRLSARRTQAMIVIEVSDDGRGMSAQHIADVAVKRGVVTAETAKEMSEQEKLQLICHAGFSLREEVTSVSGRGVGMGVIKQIVETLRGTLEIETQPGQGSTIRISLPIMLALVNATLIKIGNELYALPAVQVKHIIKIDPANIEQIGDQEVIYREDGVLPLKKLSALLHIPNANPEPEYALIVQHNGKTVGLRADVILEHEEIVVKPLPSDLRHISGLAGVTILGEGQVVLILDTRDILKLNIPASARQET